MDKTETSAILRRMEVRMAEVGMSKEKFYELSGISSASFSQWNTGAHKPTKKKLAQAAAVLDVNLEYLLTGEPDEKSSPSKTESEPTDLQKQVMAMVQKMSSEELEQFIRVAKAIKGE